jgi:hypothetical protein
MKINLSIRCLALVLILSLTVVTGCIRAADNEYGSRGEILSIGAHKPKLLDKVVYTIQDMNGRPENWVITPKEEGFKIAVVQTRAVNTKSTQVDLSVDENTAMLTAKDGGGEFKAFKADKMRVEKTSEEAPKGNPYGSHIWGPYQLFKNFEIAGYLFFEVPDGTEFADMIWDDVEFVRVVYPR